MSTSLDPLLPSLHVLVGSPKLLEKYQVTVPAYALEIAKSYRAGGKVAIYMAVNGNLKCIMGVSDAVRSEAVYVIRALKRQGMLLPNFVSCASWVFAVQAVILTR